MQGTGFAVYQSLVKDDSCEIFFDEKPDKVEIDALGKDGAKFRWHHTKRCWYGKKSNLPARYSGGRNLAQQEGPPQQVNEPAIMIALKCGKNTIRDIAEVTGLSTDELASALDTLEVHGKVTKTDNKYTVATPATPAPPPAAKKEPFARFDETLAQAIDRKYPDRKGRGGAEDSYGSTYQNGVKPGETKLKQFREVMALRGVPGLYETENIPSEQKMAYVKLFNPSGSWTWYVTEFSPTAPDGALDLAFGLVDGHEEELGYIDLAELSNLPDIGIEIDMHWTPRLLKDCYRKAKQSPPEPRPEDIDTTVIAPPVADNAEDEIQTERMRLESLYGKVYDTRELGDHFEVISFMAPLCICREKATGMKGMISFQHRPRFYFDFQPDAGEKPVLKVETRQIAEGVTAIQMGFETPAPAVPAPPPTLQEVSTLRLKAMFGGNRADPSSGKYITDGLILVIAEHAKDKKKFKKLIEKTTGNTPIEDKQIKPLLDLEKHVQEVAKIVGYLPMTTIFPKQADPKDESLALLRSDKSDVYVQANRLRWIMEHVDVDGARIVDDPKKPVFFTHKGKIVAMMIQATFDPGDLKMVKAAFAKSAAHAGTQARVEAPAPKPEQPKTKITPIRSAQPSLMDEIANITAMLR